MQQITTYIIEKLHLTAGHKQIMADEELTDLLHEYGINDSEFKDRFMSWHFKYEISKFELYGWPGINNIMNTYNKTNSSYIENKDELKKLTDKLVKYGFQTPGKDKQNGQIFYWTDELFGMINNKDKTLAIIAKKA